MHHLPDHFNNYTYYYPFIDQILPLEAKHGLDAYKKIIFLYNIILSQSPDIYMDITRRGPAQDVPFNLILWYKAKTIPTL